MTFRDIIIRHVVIIAAVTLSFIQITATAAAEVSPLHNEQYDSSYILPPITITAKMNTHNHHRRRRLQQQQQQQTKVMKRDGFQNSNKMTTTMTMNMKQTTLNNNEGYKKTTQKTKQQQQQQQQNLPPNNRIRTSTNTVVGLRQQSNNQRRPPMDDSSIRNSNTVGMQQQPNPRRPERENDSSSVRTSNTGVGIQRQPNPRRPERENDSSVRNSNTVGMQRQPNPRRPERENNNSSVQTSNAGIGIQQRQPNPRRPGRENDSSIRNSDTVGMQQPNLRRPERENDSSSVRTSNTVETTRKQPPLRRPERKNDDSSGDETTATDNNPKEKKSAVAILLSNTDGDFIDLCLALRSMNAYNVIPTSSPIYIFIEKDFPPSRKKDLAKCSSNPLSFELARLGSHFLRTRAEDINEQQQQQEEEEEEGISPADDQDVTPSPESNTLWNDAVANMGSSLGRKKWGYVESIRFWTTLVWRHPALDKYDTIMRIDTDSCFTAPPSDVTTTINDEDGIGISIADANRYLPGLPPPINTNHPIVYRSTGPMALGSNVWVSNLYSFAVSYMTAHEITPSHPQLWNEIRTAWDTHHTLPVFRKNFEIMDRHFFRRYDVMSWHEALTEREPYGVLRYRWGEAQTRVLTVAMFATRESVLVVKEGDGYVGYRHGRGECAKFLGVTSGW